MVRRPFDKNPWGCITPPPCTGEGEVINVLCLLFTKLYHLEGFKHLPFFPKMVKQDSNTLFSQ